MIKLFWWNRGPRYGNFGDEFSSTLIRHLSSRMVDHAPLESANAVASGSLLEHGFADGLAWSGSHEKGSGSNGTVGM